MYIVCYICTHVAHTAAPLYYIIQTRGMCRYHLKPFYMCLTRVWLIPGAHTSAAADGVKEKNWVKKTNGKTVLRDDGDGVSFFSFPPPRVPKSFSACVTRVLRYRRPCIIIVIIALRRFFQEIKRARQLSSRYSSITRRTIIAVVNIVDNGASL